MVRIVSSSNSRWKSSAACGVALLMLACAPGVPAPSFPTPFDVVAPDSIRAYLARLKFDYRDGAGDAQHLLLGCPAACRVGPLVAIYPEKRIHNNKHSNLATGPGRIIAQLINQDDTASYLPLNLGPRDTVYWAVDSVTPVNRELSRGRSLFISAAALRGERGPVVVRDTLFIDEHPDEETIKTSAARWIVDTTGYIGREVPGGDVRMLQLWALAVWANCKSGGCCR